MVRVVANLSIHPEVGPDIAKNVEIVALLIQVLGILWHFCNLISSVCDGV